MGHITVVRSNSTNAIEMVEFAGASADDIATYAGVYLTTRGYHLESGDRYNGIYGRGSAAGHMLVGALAPRYKFDLQVLKSDVGASVMIKKAMSGISGGPIGMHQMTKEFQELRTGLENFIVAKSTLDPVVAAPVAAVAPAPAAAAPVIVNNAAGVAAPVEADIPDQIRKFGELLAQGLLTKEEFEAKKAELLLRRA